MMSQMNFNECNFHMNGHPMQIVIRRYFRSLLLLSAVLLLSSGCATRPTAAKVEERSLPGEQPAPRPVENTESAARATPLPEPPPAQVYELEETAPYESLPPPEPVEQKASPAVVALLDDADAQAASGKGAQAAASLERALRIEPKNPLLWHKLGKVRLQEGKWDQAIAMAKKSNVLAPGNKALQSDNWFIIAKAREGMGDQDGALQALDTMQQLRN